MGTDGVAELGALFCLIKQRPLIYTSVDLYPFAKTASYLAGEDKNQCTARIGLIKLGKVMMIEKTEIKEAGLSLRPDTTVIAGFARMPQNITGQNFASYITVEFEIEPVDSKVVGIYSTLLPFVEKEILYKACLENNIDFGIKKAIEQLDERFFGATKRAIISALEDAYKCYRKIVKTRRTGNLNIKIEHVINKSKSSRPVRRRKSQAGIYSEESNRPEARQ